MTHRFICTSAEPIVQTAAGKLRGFILDGIYTFHGIKYADAERFRLPVPVQPWDGVKDALNYGYVCPMIERESVGGELLVPHRYWPKDEHCQYLNIWSPSLTGARKPVMVWLHGGGQSWGSSIEQVAYDGANLSRFGNVVTVTLNHRLNILGYFDLSHYGDRYRGSANAGCMDIVAALEWIRDNIAAFGGDPDNVTVFGQSGGGDKITFLLQSPAARGLFHKAIIMSGVSDFPHPRRGQDTKAISLALLRELGLTEDRVGELETLPYETLAAAYAKVREPMRREGQYVGCDILQDEFYPGNPREVGFSEHARGIPLIAGSVIAEQAFGPGIPGKHSLNRDEEMRILTNVFGDSAGPLAALFEQAYPDKALTDLVFLDACTRKPTREYCMKKASESTAPVFNYVFTYEFPINDGRPAWHCSDIPFAFHNTELVPVCCIPDVSDRLEKNMSGAFTHFAWYGVPDHEGIPHWPACTPDKVATMRFDAACSVGIQHDRALYEAFLPVAPDPWKVNGGAGPLH